MENNVANYLGISKLAKLGLIKLTLGYLTVKI